MHEMIELAWNDRNLLRDADVVNHIETVIEKLDRGEIRVAEPLADDANASNALGVTAWKVNDWVKKLSLIHI